MLQCCRIRQADAWSHVAGYSAYNDGSVRDWQKHTIQFTAGKNFTGTALSVPGWSRAARLPMAKN